MLDHVRERFLDHAEHRQVESWRQLVGQLADAQIDRQPGRGQPVDQRVQLGQTRLRLELGGRGAARCPRVLARRLRRAEQSEKVTELGHRRASARLYGQHRRPGLAGRLGQDLPGRAGLHDHDTDAVRDDVVELAGDPGAFELERAAGGGLVLGEHPVAFPDGMDGVPHGHGQRQRHQDQERGRTPQHGAHDHPEPGDGHERRAPEAAVHDRRVTREDDDAERDRLHVVASREHLDHQQHARRQRVAPAGREQCPRDQQGARRSAIADGQAHREDNEHGQRRVGVQVLPGRQRPRFDGPR